MPPVIASWGAGIDSTAMIIELAYQGAAPDLVLMADTVSEFPQTDNFVPIFRKWMTAHHIPNHIVRYQPTRLNGLPSYQGLLEYLLATATLPSIAFGRHTCSLKWKVAPQHTFVRTWQPALDSWTKNQPVIRLIGYDASPRDTQRYAHAETHEDSLYFNRYPLREWGWTRPRSAQRILDAGLPLPRKSSCFFCTACKPDEIRTLPPRNLELIVLLEAAAAPRLRTIEGLWRKTTLGRGKAQPRPGSMTQYIADHSLLAPERINEIMTDILTSLLQHAQRNAGENRTMAEWLDHHFPRREDPKEKGRGDGLAKTTPTGRHDP